jgi:hypothetical protein
VLVISMSMAGTCDQCGYSLEGLDGQVRCPECGNPMMRYWPRAGEHYVGFGGWLTVEAEAGRVRMFVARPHWVKTAFAVLACVCAMWGMWKVFWLKIEGGPLAMLIIACVGWLAVWEQVGRQWVGMARGIGLVAKGGVLKSRAGKIALADLEWLEYVEFALRPRLGRGVPGLRRLVARVKSGGRPVYLVLLDGKCLSRGLCERIAKELGVPFVATELGSVRAEGIKWSRW